MSEGYAQSRKQRVAIALGAILLLLLIAGVVLTVIVMLQNPDKTETVRDIVIIFMAVETLLIGLVLILLLIQLTRLTVLLQSEVKPILESTNETVQTLRGTSAFLSKNMIKPVMKVQGSVAAIRRAFGLIRIRRAK